MWESGTLDRQILDAEILEFRPWRFLIAGVWVIVDDACNSCVHGIDWRKNAEKKFRMKGLQCVLVNHVPTDFTGLGKMTTEGKWKMPLCLKLLESGMVLPGAVCSHEVDSDHPLLLSQNCQAKLGMIKKMRQPAA